MEGNAPIGASVDELIAARLDKADLTERAAELVLAALLGDDELLAVISGGQTGFARQPAGPTARHRRQAFTSGRSRSRDSAGSARRQRSGCSPARD
jgi:hypothetical protein